VKNKEKAGFWWGGYECNLKAPPFLAIVFQIPLAFFLFVVRLFRNRTKTAHISTVVFELLFRHNAFAYDVF
jgi:hypothetical protein